MRRKGGNEGATASSFQGSKMLRQAALNQIETAGPLG
jgi:hypothetical protein